MREIQEMTLNVSRGLERLDKRLADRAKCFEQEFRYLENPSIAFGVRVTAVPIGDEILFDRVYRSRKIVDEFDESWRRIFLMQKGGTPSEFETFPPLKTIFWRPMLRAARADDTELLCQQGCLKQSCARIQQLPRSTLRRISRIGLRCKQIVFRFLRKLSRTRYATYPTCQSHRASSSIKRTGGCSGSGICY